jgi:dicarboxylate/amino acid:cation (Na+ or H+) symporter, DAACS family
MRPTLAVQMLTGLVVGALGGTIAHAWWIDGGRLAWVTTTLVEPVGAIFLRLLFMLVLPLVVSGLALGIAGVGDARTLGRIGLRTLIYTVAVSTIAVVLGVTLVNLVRPGEGLPDHIRAALTARASALPPAAGPSKTGAAFFVQLVPANLVQAMHDGDMLAVMVFALFLGFGLVITPTAAARRFEETLTGLYDVVMRLLDVVLRLAPLGVACLVFSLTARAGWELLRPLGAYVGVVLAALAIQQFVVYALIIRWLGGMSPRRFYRAIRAAMLTAFSTASSNATLPTALKVADEELHLPAHVSRFVLTIGSTANQNGTALFEGVTVLFLAQFYGVELTLAQQFMVTGVCILGGIGTAGVPAGSLPVIAMILGMVGVPPDGIGMILGIDRVLDMCRTTLNVTGDLVAAVVVSRGEA